MGHKTKEAEQAYGIAYRAKNAKREKDRKAEWYRKNRAEIMARQKARRAASKAGHGEG